MSVCAFTSLFCCFWALFAENIPATPSPSWAMSRGFIGEAFRRGRLRLAGAVFRRGDRPQVRELVAAPVLQGLLVIDVFAFEGGLAELVGQDPAGLVAGRAVLHLLGLRLIGEVIA